MTVNYQKAFARSLFFQLYHIRTFEFYLLMLFQVLNLIEKLAKLVQNITSTKADSPSTRQEIFCLLWNSFNAVSEVLTATVMKSLIYLMDLNDV
jgi:hypothetical protein